jgi:hypothetical protein
MRSRQFSPAPGPIGTLHPILERIADVADPAKAPVFTCAKTVFDKAMADGWANLDIAAVYDQLAGRTVRVEDSV